MHANEAVLWFSNTPLAGWNGTAWVSDISVGSLQTYDRFITERTFGTKKRIFLTHVDNQFDPATYPVVRTPDSKVWIVVGMNADVDAGPYAQSYLMVVAEHTAEVITFSTTTLASGQQGNAVEVKTGPYYCDLDQFSVDRSDEFNATVYGLYKIVLPGGTLLTDDNELLIDGVRYEVQEAYGELLTVAARALRRGASV